MKFEALAKLCERLFATTKRNLMTDMVADSLKQLEEEELEPAVSMILGGAFPRWDHRTLDISWTILGDIITRSTKTSLSEFSAAFRETGDIGAATQVIFEKNKIMKQTTLLENPLEILEVRRVLEAVAESTGHGSMGRKERLIESLLRRATPLEAKYLVKIIMREMRIGFQEGLMEIAVAKAFSIPIKVIQKATMFVGDIGEVASICKKQGNEGISSIGLKVFRPIKPMLAQTAEDPKDALAKHGGKTAFEYKLDGARIQIHKSLGEVKIFSRQLTDITASLPEIIKLVCQEVKSREAILEGEVIALGKDENPLPFQHLMRRFRRIYKIDQMVKEIPVRLYLFDAIYVNGKNLMSLPYNKRRKKLKKAAGNIHLTEQLVAKNPQKAELFLEEAIDKGHEGLIAKRLDGPYTPGIRDRHWFKIKKTLEPLDLVIVAAEYGHGRRHKWLSDYYLAAKDRESGEFLTLGKTFKGLTDQEMDEITKRLRKLALKEEGRRIIFIPEIVVEVLYNEIQKSTKYNCGMALRFARINRLREDKSPQEVDTIQRVRKIYENQFEKKAKYP